MHKLKHIKLGINLEYIPKKKLRSPKNQYFKFIRISFSENIFEVLKVFHFEMAGFGKKLPSKILFK